MMKFSFGKEGKEEEGRVFLGVYLDLIKTF